MGCAHIVQIGIRRNLWCFCGPCGLKLVVWMPGVVYYVVDWIKWLWNVLLKSGLILSGIHKVAGNHASVTRGRRICDVLVNCVHMVWMPGGVFCVLKWIKVTFGQIVVICWSLELSWQEDTELMVNHADVHFEETVDDLKEKGCSGGFCVLWIVYCQELFSQLGVTLTLCEFQFYPDLEKNGGKHK